MTAFSNSIYCVLGPIIDGSICSGWTKDKLYRGNSALRVAAVAFWHRIMVDEDPPLRVAAGRERAPCALCGGCGDAAVVGHSSLSMAVACLRCVPSCCGWPNPPMRGLAALSLCVRWAPP
ncbi:hypothetical protein TcCL_ESM04226 [Trypanosoma cruzi]|nr:hypothetical protein TcCL_NonESM00380 [Trypanosoma cruzi]RNC58179.1 hypothetical protein TcCL_ESM04226 [Trypanosoma cruzi]